MANNKRVIIEIHTEKLINDLELRTFVDFVVANAYNKEAYKAEQPMEVIAFRGDKEHEKIHRLIQRAQRKLRLKEKSNGETIE